MITRDAIAAEARSWKGTPWLRDMRKLDMSIWETNKNILAALQTVIVDLPDKITSLTLSMSVDKIPELTITSLVISRASDRKPERFDVTKRYTLTEINHADEMDVSVLQSPVREYAAGPPIKGSVA